MERQERLETEPVTRRGGKLGNIELTEDRHVDPKRQYHVAGEYSRGRKLKTATHGKIESKISSHVTAFFTEVSLSDKNNFSGRSFGKEDNRQIHRPPEIRNNSPTFADVSFRIDDHALEHSVTPSNDNFFIHMEDRARSTSPLGMKRQFFLTDRDNGPRDRKFSNEYILKVRPETARVFESNSIERSLEPHRPKQILIKHATGNTVKHRFRAINFKKRIGPNKEALEAADAKLQRDYISFKPPTPRELTDTDEQKFILEQKSHIVNQLEETSKFEEIDLLRYFIAQEKEAMVLKRNTVKVNINPAFKAKQERKRKETLRTSSSRLSESRGGDSFFTNRASTPPIVRAIQRRSQRRVDDDQHFVSLSSNYHPNQFLEQYSMETHEKIPYPVGGLKQNKLSSLLFKQRKVVRKHRKLMKAEHEEEEVRLRSFKG